MSVASTDLEAGVRAPRQIVVCCDGTNNTLTAGRADTHVLRIYEHLKHHPAARRDLFYDPGVGSPAGAPPTDPGDWLARTLERMSGLASGRGIYTNISDAYLFLMQHYRSADDQIYLFGFSRGAFTARCVAGMVNLFGIIGMEHQVMLPTLIRVYFSLPDAAQDDIGNPVHSLMRRLTHDLSTAPVGRSALARQIRTDFTDPPGRDAWVHWVGVWDTVESVGLPGPLSRSNPSTATFRDKRFRHVRHAVSMDEHRWTFEPRLYEEPGDVDEPGDGSGDTLVDTSGGTSGDTAGNTAGDGSVGKPGRGSAGKPVVSRSLKQRWFPGAHCDVGGGYTPERAGLGEATFVWMIGEAIACGLEVTPLTARPVRATSHDALWDSPWWALAGMCLRDMRPTTSKGTPIAVVAGPTAAPPVYSAWERRRSVAALVLALLLGVLCVQRSGASLHSDGWGTMLTPDTWWPHTWNAIRFAQERLVGPKHRWLWLVEHYDPAPVFWAMAWDFAFVACWGYLLARIASRSFGWLAGKRRPGEPLPAWRFVGFMPLMAVGGDFGENLTTLAAFAAHGAGVDSWAKLLLLLGSASAVLKYVGLVGCLPLLLVRFWIALPWVRRAPAHAARPPAGAEA